MLRHGRTTSGSTICRRDFLALGPMLFKVNWNCCRSSSESDSETDDELESMDTISREECRDLRNPIMQTHSGDEYQNPAR